MKYTALKTNKLLDSSFISLIFFFILDDNKNLSVISEHLLKRFAKMLNLNLNKYILNSKNIDLNKKIEFSSEYLIIYILFILMNHPIYCLKKIKILNVKKIFLSYLEIINKNENPNKFNYITSILNSLKNKNYPQIFEEIEVNNVNFFQMKVPTQIKNISKKLRERIEKIGENDINEKFNCLIEIFDETILEFLNQKNSNRFFLVNVEMPKGFYIQQKKEVI